MNKILIILFVCISLFGAPRVGDNAVIFELPNLYAQEQLLSSQTLKGKVILLNLWASWCNGCKEEMPHFVKLQNEYTKDKFEIVLVSIDNVAQSARDFLAQVDKEKLLTSLYDEKKILPKTYKCPGMPSSFLIDKNGKIVEVYIGSLDEEAMLKLNNKIKTLVGE